MSLARCLNEARLVRLFQHLLGKRHQPGVLHQASPLRDLSRQRLAAFLPRRLQSLSERRMALGQSCRQIPDALS